LSLGIGTLWIMARDEEGADSIAHKRHEKNVFMLSVCPIRTGL